MQPPIKIDTCNYKKRQRLKVNRAMRIWPLKHVVDPDVQTKKEAKQKKAAAQSNEQVKHLKKETCIGLVRHQ
jgi:hypothetical protein